MKVTYDDANDMVCITFSDGLVMKTGTGDPFSSYGHCVETGVDEEDKVIRIRVLAASRNLPPGTVEELKKSVPT